MPGPQAPSGRCTERGKWAEARPSCAAGLLARTCIRKLGPEQAASQPSSQHCFTQWECGTDLGVCMLSCTLQDSQCLSIAMITRSSACSPLCQVIMRGEWQYPSSRRPPQLLTENTETYTAGLPPPPSALTSCAMLLRNTRPVPHPAVRMKVHRTAQLPVHTLPAHSILSHDFQSEDPTHKPQILHRLFACG